MPKLWLHYAIKRNLNVHDQIFFSVFGIFRAFYSCSKTWKIQIWLHYLIKSLTELFLTLKVRLFSRAHSSKSNRAYTEIMICSKYTLDKRGLYVSSPFAGLYYHYVVKVNLSYDHLWKYRQGYFFQLADYLFGCLFFRAVCCLDLCKQFWSSLYANI